MFLKEYIDSAYSVNLENIKELTIEDIILQFHAKNLKRIYLLKNNLPVFVITPKEIVDFFIKGNIKQNIYEFLKETDPIGCFDGKKHIIDAYYEMRKDKLDFIPVCENGKFIGEIDFSVLSLKISYIVIKDELSGVYNKKYFDVIVNEYTDFNKPLGIIFIELKDLSIYEGLYGMDFSGKVIKNFAQEIQNSVRKIDFVFRWDNQFRIIIFNNLEISAKIFSRIQNRLKTLETDSIHIPFKMCFSHVPEMQDDILLALQSCEEELIKRE